MLAKWRDDCVHMIWHHDIIKKLVTIVVEMPQSRLNQLAYFRPRQHASAVSLIEPVLKPCGEAFPIFAPFLFGMRPRILRAAILRVLKATAAIFPAGANLPSET